MESARKREREGERQREQKRDPVNITWHILYTTTWGISHIGLKEHERTKRRSSDYPGKTTHGFFGFARRCFIWCNPVIVSGCMMCLHHVHRPTRSLAPLMSHTGVCHEQVSWLVAIRQVLPPCAAPFARHFQCGPHG